MSVHDEMKYWQKFLWLILMAAFLGIELKAISKDRSENEEVQRIARDADQKSFKEILGQQRTQFATVIREQQADFSQTMKTFESGQSSEYKQFAGVVKKENELYSHEESLAESLSGTLIPANLATPHNGCFDSPGPYPSTVLPPNGVVVILGSNASYFSHYPHTVLAVNGLPMLQITEISRGVLVPIMDVSGPDGKIVARFNQDGYLIGSHLVVSRPDRSTLDVTDDYGTKALHIHYLNRQAIEISGYVNYQGHRVSIERPSMTNSCAGDTNVDVNVRLTSQ